MTTAPSLQSLFRRMPQHDSELYEPEARAAPRRGRTAPRQGHILQLFDRVRRVTDQVPPDCASEIHLRTPWQMRGDAVSARSGRFRWAPNTLVRNR